MIAVGAGDHPILPELGPQQRPRAVLDLFLALLAEGLQALDGFRLKERGLGQVLLPLRLQLQGQVAEVPRGGGIFAGLGLAAGPLLQTVE